ncbi:MAG: hypothetical protein M3348_11345 [Acidobacteriota bacterium]|nr:hypothetical protein [Acidobacteriota bacterium]
MAAAQDFPITISGGSVIIEFDVSQFQGDGYGRFSNAKKKIKRVEVSSDGVNIAEVIPDGKVVIRVFYGNP